MNVILVYLRNFISFHLTLENFFNDLKAPPPTLTVIDVRIIYYKIINEHRVNLLLIYLQKHIKCAKVIVVQSLRPLLNILLTLPVNM